MRRLTLLACAAVLAPSLVQADPLYSTLYVFGDSLSDPGNLAQHGVGWPVPPYDGQRFSNGPTYAERLPALLGFPLVESQNHALGGAESGTGNFANSLIPLGLPGIQTEITSFIGGGGGTGNTALVIVFGGANDYFAYLGQTQPVSQLLAGVDVAVAATVANLEQDIRLLAAAGSKRFLVPNVPDLGATPDYRGMALQPVADALSEAHRQQLEDAMAGLARELGVEIVVADFYSGLNVVLADPAAFGITNVTDACVTSTSGFPSYITPSAPCAAPDEHLFWDGVHPTSAAHQLLAEFAADTLLAPTTIAAQINFATLAADAFLRRVEDAVAGQGAEGRGLSMMPPPKGSGEETSFDAFLTLQRSFGSQTSSAEAAGFDYGLTSIVGGLLYQPVEHVAVGLVGGYDTGSADLSGWNADVDYRSFRIGVAGGYDDGTLFGGLGFAYGFDSYDLSRQTVVAPLSASADPGGRSLGAYGSAGYRFTMEGLTFGPILGLRYINLAIDSYAETGAPGLDMNVERQTADSLIGSAGLGLAYELDLAGLAIIPHLEMAAEYDLLDGDREIETSLVTVPGVVRRLGVDQDEGVYGRLAGGIALTIAPAVTAQIDGETTFGRKEGNDHGVFGSLSVTF